MQKNIIADTGFWYALYDIKDSYYTKANNLLPSIETHNLLLPWPCLYETINTKFAKKKEYMQAFEIFVGKNNVNFIDDKIYKDTALRLAFAYWVEWKRPFSLVDLVLREILLDDSYKIDYLITYNTGDFIDVCQTRKISILS